ncbi:MAG TPA: hypothetical protein VF698_05360 [Thermoanaerobaculia bacterium]|jgi:hypothetical protein
MRRIVLAVLALLLAVAAHAQDVLTIGSATATGGASVALPVSLRDRNGTALDANGGNRIQGIAFKVMLPAELVQSVSFARAGVLAPLTPLHQATPQGSGWTAYVASFSAGSNPIPFTTGAPAPGDRIGTLTLTLAPGLASGTVVPVRFDPPSAMLANQAGSVVETVAAGNLALVNGTVTVTDASPFVFTDDPLTPGTPIKLVHITELRAAVNAMRARAGLAALPADPTLAAGLVVRAQHITTLRAALNEARTALGLPPLTYAEATLTVVKASHVQELRNGTA